MRYPTTEKLKIIRLFEASYLLVKQTLDKLGIPRPPFYREKDQTRYHPTAPLEHHAKAA